MRAILFTVPLLAALPVLGQIPPQPLFPQSLRDYLQLTAAQIESIGKLNLAYDQYVVSKQPRLNDLQSDIARRTAAEPIEPLALGQDYVEIEAIQRDLRSKNTQLLADNARVLTDAQRTQIKSLADAQALQPVLSDAMCQTLLELDPTSRRLYPSTMIDFSTGVLPIFVSDPYYGYCTAGNMTAGLATYLVLTPAQLDAINQLNQRYLQFTGEKQTRISQVQASLADLMAAPVLDPAAIGAGYAEIEAINRDLRAKQADLRTNVAKVLTPPQATRVKALDDVTRLQPVISAAQCESLLAPAPSPLTGAPVTRSPFPGNIIPITRFDPVLRYCAY